MKKPPLWLIIHEDDHVVAVNKSSGISVIGDRWIQTKERLDKLLAQELGLTRVYAAHRIDNGTSGIVVFAKDIETYKKLSIAFTLREVEKRYIVIVHGRPSWTEESCDLPLLADANKKHLTIVEKFRGKKSLTHFTRLYSAGNYSVLYALPETGRQHQIRVHLANMGYPVVCDDLYGNTKPVYLSQFKRKWRGEHESEKPLLSRLGLHAEKLVIRAYPLNLETRPPRDMTALIHQIEKCGSKPQLVSSKYSDAETP